MQQGNSICYAQVIALHLCLPLTDQDPVEINCLNYLPSPPPHHLQWETSTKKQLQPHYRLWLSHCLLKQQDIRGRSNYLQLLTITGCLTCMVWKKRGIFSVFQENRNLAWLVVMEISQLDAISPKKWFPLKKQNAEGLDVRTRNGCRTKSSSAHHILQTHNTK